MSPDWTQRFETFARTFWSEKDALHAQALEWGFPTSPEDFERSPEGDLVLPEGVFRYSEAVKDGVRQGWCKHHCVRELRKFLKDNGYPERLRALRLITRIGYAKALGNQLQARREEDARRHREARKEKREEGQQ